MRDLDRTTLIAVLVVALVAPLAACRAEPVEEVPEVAETTDEVQGPDIEAEAEPVAAPDRAVVETGSGATVSPREKSVGPLGEPEAPGSLEADSRRPTEPGLRTAAKRLRSTVARQEISENLTIEQFFNLNSDQMFEAIFSRLDPLMANLKASTINGKEKPPELRAQHLKVYDILHYHFYGRPRDTANDQSNAMTGLFFDLKREDSQAGFAVGFRNHIKGVIRYYEDKPIPPARPSSPG